MTFAGAVEPRRLAVTVLAALTVVAAVACGAGGVDGAASQSGGGGGSSGGGGGGGGRLVRTASVSCASAVFSPGQTWPDRWPASPRQAVVAGPVAWPDARELASDSGFAPSAFAPHDGLALVVESLVAVTDGSLARVGIPASEGERLSLDYTDLQPRTAAGRYRVSDGAQQVTFRACSRGSTEGPSSLFEGGFIVAGAQCATVDVYADEVAGGPPIERRIPFGVPARTCR